VLSLLFSPVAKHRRLVAYPGDSCSPLDAGLTDMTEPQQILWIQLKLKIEAGYLSAFSHCRSGLATLPSVGAIP